MERNDILSVKHVAKVGDTRNDIKADKGQWKNRGFESGTVSAIIDNKSIVIENCHFKSGDDFLQASGHFNGVDKYRIDRL